MPKATALIARAQKLQSRTAGLMPDPDRVRFYSIPELIATDDQSEQLAELEERLGMIEHEVGKRSELAYFMRGGKRLSLAVDFHRDTVTRGGEVLCSVGDLVASWPRVPG